MGKKLKKGTRGTAVNYLTRGQALNKLQIDLSTFRRLCILKGIHPREPRKKLHGNDKTYYHAKDIRWLMHEPLLDNFRKRAAHQKKIRKAVSKNNVRQARRLASRKPNCGLDHLIKERYPSFVDALRDLDDPLTMVHLFAVLPSASVRNMRIPLPTVLASKRLAMEFDAYVVKAHALRKIFVSVRGFYYQAEIMGQNVNWLAPHNVQQVLPTDVDYGVLKTFMDFYKTFLQFVNFKLYHTLGLRYPPPKDPSLDAAGAFLESIMVEFAKSDLKEVDSDERAADTDAGAPISQASRERFSGLKGKIQEIVDEVVAEHPDRSSDENLDEEAEGRDINNEGVDDDEKKAEESESEEVLVEEGKASEDADEVSDLDAEEIMGEEAAGATAGLPADDEAALCENLFRGLVFFLGRECPMEPLMFTIRAFGGKVGWEGSESPIQRSDESVTHEVCDRPKPTGPVVDSRQYLQPQWVFDSCNARVLLPIAPYAPGKAPPPHLSPFANEDEEGYVPDYAKTIKNIQNAVNIVRQTMSAPSGGGQDEKEGEDLELEQLDEIEKAEAQEKAYMDELNQELGAEKTSAMLPKDGGKGKKGKKVRKRSAADAIEENKAMSEIMIPKKHRYMYNMVKDKEAEKAARIEELKKRRDAASMEDE